MNKEQIEEALKTAIQKRRAETRPERDRIYEAARSAIGRKAATPETALSMLDEAIERIELSFNPPAAPIVSQIRRRWAGALPQFAAGAAAGALLAGAVAAAYIAYQSVPDADDSQERLQSLYEKSRVQVPVAMDFLSQVVDAVIERQKTDGAKIVSASKMILLNTFDPELAKRMPKTLPKGTIVVLRANAFDLKVLFNSPVCSAVNITSPKMVDPVRGDTKNLGCSYFGQWTPGAARW